MQECRNIDSCPKFAERTAMLAGAQHNGKHRVQRGFPVQRSEGADEAWPKSTAKKVDKLTSLTRYVWTDRRLNIMLNKLEPE